MDRVIRNFFLFLKNLFRTDVRDQAFPWLPVFLADLLEFRDHDSADFFIAAKDFFHLDNFFFQAFRLLCPLENILPIKMAQLDFCDIFCLGGINPKANH